MWTETTIRLGFCLGLFVVFAALEALAPRRALTSPLRRRWTTNIAFAAIDSFALRALAFVLPALAVGAAADAQAGCVAAQGAGEA
jgi:hypothetical protein